MIAQAAASQDVIVTIELSRLPTITQYLEGVVGPATSVLTLRFLFTAPFGLHFSTCSTAPYYASSSLAACSRLVFPLLPRGSLTVMNPNGGRKPSCTRST